MSYTLAEIAEKIDATLISSSQGDGDKCKVDSLATLASAGAGQIAFLSNTKYRQQLSSTKANAVILDQDCLDDIQNPAFHALVMKNPYMGYAIVAQLLDNTPATAKAIHASAVIAQDASLGENVNIGANTVIESGAVIADNVSIGAGCFIGEQARIGANTSLWSNVSIYHRVEIGQHCLIQANTVIGCDGFGYAKDNGSWFKIPQLGTVIIGDNVEIGASTTIDRGALENTLISNGVILDNQIQIAHNVVIGENTAMAACSVIAGSTVVGKNCSISGLVGINGHIEITDGCVFTGQAMVTKSITEPGVYSSGTPAVANREWNKNNARIRRLDGLSKRVKSLEKAFENVVKNGSVVDNCCPFKWN
ncbi:MAG: UDP-3-O-(3-hydroxymyristoyl)glucosamine N-acyltransferase [Alteromonadaceae bacterium]|nr:UDP-3-O-(3-hydroxymyristoyl)glucosamine N-acyltransferase [Alteromonadaceae bacterium]